MKIEEELKKMEEELKKKRESLRGVFKRFWHCWVKATHCPCYNGLFCCWCTLHIPKKEIEDCD